MRCVVLAHITIGLLLATTGNGGEFTPGTEGRKLIE